MIALILKIFIMLFLGTTYNHVVAQQPTNATIVSDLSYRGIIAYPGIPASNAPTWLWVRDSTRLAMHPRKFVFDSLFNNPSLGNPSNFLWVRNSDSSLVYSKRDSLLLTQSQISGLSTILSTKQSNVTLTTTGTSGSSTFISNTLNIPNYANSGGTVTSIGITSTDFSVSGSPITTSGNITTNLNVSGVDAGTYQKFTINNKGIVTGAQLDSFSSVTRPINSTTYTVSRTKNSRVYYTINITCTATIGSASSGSVSLQYSTNVGSSWIDIGNVKNSNTVTLALALNSITIQESQICGEIPINALVRMNQTSTGTTTISFVRGQEIY